MKIVEYNELLAARVADMWNKSGSNWGNDDSVKTTEDVLKEEANSGNLKLYLAIDDKEEVVGYCSYSEYEYDEGASYLSLLNVRPDYHGKKVGKALILETIKQAVKDPWPRFDLFTWSGNIKAMPLYKKCGFFWEKNNDAVHLMNFLPYLYNTNALKPYLDKISWYEDSKRVIDMNQDGEEINGFDSFRYHFENDLTYLKAEFERTGRGLHYIETPDYSFRMHLPKHELVYENSYEVTFDIINKKDDLLTIELEGVLNKNIVTEFKEKVTVDKELTITKTFFVKEYNKKLDKFKTHPLVECNILINGESATFKLGVEPKSPVYVKLHVPQYNHVLTENYVAYLDMENNLSEETRFTVDLTNPYFDVLNDLEVSLKPKEKRSLKVEYTPKKFGYINEQITIKYNDSSIQKEVKAIFKGHEEVFNGEDDQMAYLVDGNYHIGYVKEQNHVGYNRHNEGGNPYAAFMTPKIGLPFSLDFANQIPVISFPKENVMESELTSKDFDGIKLITRCTTKSGMMNTHYELVNTGDKRTISLSFSIHKPFNNTYVPYDGKILKTTNHEGGGPNSLDDSLIDENWLYDKKGHLGFTWPKQYKLELSGWRFAFTIKDITLDKGETFKTEDFIISYVHPNLKSFRAFAGNFKELETTRFLELELNNKNPFTNKETVSLKVINKRKKKMEGSLVCNTKSTDIFDSLNVTPGYKKIVLDTKDRLIKLNRMVFDINGEVEVSNVDNEFVVNNGVITYKVSNDYSDGVYSLVYDGKEYLDSNYPKPKERAWWGTFIGGLNTRLAGQQDQVVLNEKRTNEFVQLSDNFNNPWQGIKTTVTFEKDDDYKGLTLEHYYLTLPNVKLIYSFTKVINNTGKYIFNKYFTRYNTLKVDDDKTKVTFDFNGTTYKCGDVGIEKEMKKLVTFAGTRDHNVSVYSKDNEYEVDTQSDYTIVFAEKKLSIPDNESRIFTGNYIILSKEKFDKADLIDLDNIRFEV